MRLLVLIALILVASAAVSAQGGSVGQQQPDFSARDMSGSMVNLSDLKGKVVVINLWYVNCPNCLAEIKALNQLVDEYRTNSDVVFLAPAASKQHELESFLKKYPFSYRVLPDSMMLILMKFGTPDKSGEINVPFPMHYVLDQGGKIVVKEQGIKGIESVRSEIKRLLAAKH